MSDNTTVVNDYGGTPFATHNHYCVVCSINKSVLDMHRGGMEEIKTNRTLQERLKLVNKAIKILEKRRRRHAG